MRFDAKRRGSLSEHDTTDPNKPTRGCSVLLDSMQPPATTRTAIVYLSSYLNVEFDFGSLSNTNSFPSPLASPLIFSRYGWILARSGYQPGSRRFLPSPLAIRGPDRIAHCTARCQRKASSLHKEFAPILPHCPSVQRHRIFPPFQRRAEEQPRNKLGAPYERSERLARQMERAILMLPKITQLMAAPMNLLGFHRPIEASEPT
jgi:hypothetical protein